MPGHPTPSTVDEAIKINTIVVGAMAVGLVGFVVAAGIVVLTSGAQLTAAPAQGGVRTEVLLTLIAVAVTAATFVVSKIAADANVRQARAQIRAIESADDIEKRLFAAFGAGIIIRAALAEGPALFFVVIFLLSGWWLVLLGAAVGLARLVAMRPSHARYAAFADRVLAQPQQTPTNPA